MPCGIAAIVSNFLLLRFNAKKADIHPIIYMWTGESKDGIQANIQALVISNTPVPLDMVAHSVFMEIAVVIVWVGSSKDMTKWLAEKTVKSLKKCCPLAHNIHHDISNQRRVRDQRVAWRTARRENSIAL